jgi:hypothetical protein
MKTQKEDVKRELFDKLVRKYREEVWKVQVALSRLRTNERDLRRKTTAQATNARHVKR